MAPRSPTPGSPSSSAVLPLDSKAIFAFQRDGLHAEALHAQKSEHAAAVKSHEVAMSAKEAQHASVLEKHEAAMSAKEAEHASVVEKHEAAMSAKEAEHAEVLEKHLTALANADEQVQYHQKAAKHYESRATHHENTAAEQKVDFDRQINALTAEHEQVRQHLREHFAAKHSQISRRCQRRRCRQRTNSQIPT